VRRTNSYSGKVVSQLQVSFKNSNAYNVFSLSTWFQLLASTYCRVRWRRFSFVETDPQFGPLFSLYTILDCVRLYSRGGLISDSLLEVAHSHSALVYVGILDETVQRSLSSWTPRK